jgi:hypothetical protein
MINLAISDQRCSNSAARSFVLCRSLLGVYLFLVTTNFQEGELELLLMSSFRPSLKDHRNSFENHGVVTNAATTREQTLGQPVMI